MLAASGFGPRRQPPQTRKASGIRCVGMPSRFAPSAPVVNMWWIGLPTEHCRSLYRSQPAINLYPRRQRLRQKMGKVRRWPKHRGTMVWG